MKEKITIEQAIRDLADDYSGRLKIAIDTRTEEMNNDDVSHCLVENDALEIKWRDATTDGDHITKEHTRIKVIANAGFIPIRVMFYYPNRDQAKRIQQALETLYKGVGGYYHYGDGAWDYVHKRTGVDLKAIFEKIADERLPSEAGI